ncbi:M48 family metallopeptidase [Methylosinus sp. Sm6]|uniref:M48 family metallopeptidase n=1 Tax=Methylosinus sp. Sm6 TaxID=2866948 RepID=UPI001C9A03C8|nr:M48 family metallopeptidase [Methylosinus sp. Sm6]MBY6241361.1 M48 family metallopeptidase [Methylosinus sp. Sm6]
MSAAPAPVNAGPESFFFDGVASRRRIVALRFLATALEIAAEDETLAIWPYDEIRRVDRPGFVLSRESPEAPELARLELPDARLHNEILARCHCLHGGAARVSMGRIAAWSIAATASVVVMIWFGVPFAADRLAPLVPSRLERRLGEAVDTQLRAIFPQDSCEGEAGGAALATLSSRLQRAAGLPSETTIEVLDTPVANALALPGGKIYMFAGLLRQAQAPDEVAGVLAHELGHIARRDALRRVIALGGTSYLVGLLFGDVTGASALIFASKALIGAAHSREQEAEADRYAGELLTRLGRPARPLGELLTRISSSETAALGLLQDHPLTGQRLAALAAADAGEQGPPLLDAEQWAALKAICD